MTDKCRINHQFCYRKSSLSFTSPPSFGYTWCSDYIITFLSVSGARVRFIVCATHLLVVEPPHYLLHFVGSDADCPLQGFPAILPILCPLDYSVNGQSC